MKSPTYSERMLLLVVFLLISSGAVPAMDDAAPVIPAKTKMSLQLLSPISTATSQKGDKFSCKVLTPAEYAGVIVEGHVRSVKRSGKADKESKIDLAFDRITMADGSTATFNATVVEVFEVANAGDQGRADNEGTVRSKSKTVKTSIKRAAAGALIGAVVGGAIAGGQGAAVGAAVGASVGVTTTLASKGADLEFTSGTEFTVETNGPAKRISSKSASTPIPPG
jgi:outer membrane lipoprotein SlyB